MRCECTRLYYMYVCMYVCMYVHMSCTPVARSTHTSAYEGIHRLFDTCCVQYTHTHTIHVQYSTGTKIILSVAKHVLALYLQSFLESKILIKYISWTYFQIVNALNMYCKLVSMSCTCICLDANYYVCGFASHFTPFSTTTFQLLIQPIHLTHGQALFSSTLAPHVQSHL